MVYDSIIVEFPTSDLKIYAQYVEHETSVDFNAILEYKGERCIYKTWTRKKFGVFEPSECLQVPDHRIQGIAAKFEKMGETTFNYRWKTLLLTKPTPTEL